MGTEHICYWSLIRWHQLDKLDTANATLTADGYIDASNKGSSTYHAKHYLAPIPSGQLNLNENLGQNYGWTN